MTDETYEYLQGKVAALTMINAKLFSMLITPLPELLIEFPA